MLRQTIVCLRRGKPRPRAGLFPDKYRRVPAALKPMQGGQQYFNDFMLQRTDDDLRLAAAQSQTETGMGTPLSSKIELRLPQADFIGNRDALDTALANELSELAQNDGFTNRRAFNELEYFHREMRNAALGPSSEATATVAAAGAPADASSASAATHADSEPDGTLLPDRVADNDYFKSRFGYSLVKETQLDTVRTEYKDLDLWAELPKYTRDMYFLYIISRRRNTYAVCFDFTGKRLLKPYTVGNRGLKGGDRGFRGEGSTDSGHQVTSMYINDLIPIIREQRATAGTPLQKGDKVDVVVRVMGFYNGRQGGVRAITDRSDIFNVRYFEDVTPFPLNGPRMPRGVFK